MSKPFRFNFRLGWATLLIPFLGCESTALDGPTNIAWEHFPDQLAEAHCSALERCCAAARLEFTRTDCRAQTRAAYASVFESLLVPSVRYDSKVGASCVAALKKQFETCRIDPLPEAEAQCAKVFNGSLGLDEPCTSNGECADVDGRETFCKTGSGAREDTCQLRIAETETCLLEGCERGLFCDIETLTCRRLITDGPCFLITDCAPESYCSANLSCDPKLPEGAACTNDLECKGGLCSAASTCESELATPSRCAQ